MSFEEFKTSLQQSSPPASLNALVQALWFDGKGNWEAAHNLAQDVNTNNGSWVHAYLHRKEGDVGNASYWYHRAGKKMATSSLEEEWAAIVKALL